MKLWGFYALHSFVNTIRKLFRSTFVVVVFATIGTGLIFGAVGGIIGHVAERKDNEKADQRYEASDDRSQDRGDEKNGKERESLDDGKSIWEREERVRVFVESGIAITFILCLLWGMYSGSKKGTEIFLMADVNFLFTAPMKPQSVLMFRLTFQMAAAMFASLYLVIQIPNLINLGLSGPAVAAVFVGWILLLVFQRLMVVLSYTVCTTHERLKKYLLPFLIGIVLVLSAATAAVYMRVERDPVAMLRVLYASRWSRWIPIVGWYKGMIMSASERDMTHFFLFLLLLLAVIGLFVWLIWQLKADFYEDALSQASRMAERLDAAKDGRTTRVKERAKRIRRNGSFGGWGGSAFFTKAMYDRCRTAWFRIVTVTMLINLAVSILTSVLMLRATGEAAFVVTGIVLMAVLFFRNFGNPIAQESAMNWLFLVPDSPYRKVFYSILAGSAGCALDLLPALLAGLIFARENLLVMLLWLLTFLIMDFMLSSVGAFLEALFPASAMDAVKSVLRMLLHFFMILVITVFMAVGYVLGGIVPALALTSAGCALIGGLFFLIYPSLLHGGTM